MIHTYRYILLLASHSLRSISLGNTTSSLRSKSTTRTLVHSASRYCFFSSVGGFFPLGFVLDFLLIEQQRDRERHTVSARPKTEPEATREWHRLWGAGGVRRLRGLM